MSWGSILAGHRRGQEARGWLSPRTSTRCSRSAPPLEVRRSAERLSGPGVGDNSVAVAAAIKLADLLRIAGEVPAVDVLLTGNVGEEGLGNLRGIREVLAARSDIGAVVAWKATIWDV